MGRGRSKVGGGGAPTPTKMLKLPTPEQVAAGDVLPEGGVPFADFENMTDAEKAQVITDALNTGVPMFLDDSGLQRFAYFTGMNNTPQVVSEAQLDAMSGPDIYRSVKDAYNQSTDIGYSARDIAKQISDGDFTMYSDSGGSVHGKAIYFGTDLADSTYYVAGGRNPMTIRGKIAGGRMIDESTLSSQYSSALRSGDPIAKACSRADSGSARNLYALAKGYDYVHDSWSGYHMVLNRRCLAVSSTVKPTKVGHGNWRTM